ncbi:MAG: caspase family protein [Alphaproteobacteria bacterium]|nr:caspase family protein [Alphaproteobacteria bacterium]
MMRARLAGWGLLVLVLVLMLVFVPWLAVAQQPGNAQPPTAPILRIETGRHTGVVTRLAMDAQQTLLATASLDKTVRLWNLPDGSPIATLRVPVGDGLEGSLYATALSPDGRTLLATGYTGSTWDGTYSIYMFDVAKRQIKTRMARLPAVVNDLAFAPDGRSFAAVFGGHNGFAAWSATTGKLLGEDKNYGDIATSLAFDRSGRVATVSMDGMVRLYGADFAPLAKGRTPGGRRPLSVAFAPDGQQLAIGYEDSGKVDVLSGADLKPILSVDSRGLDGGNLAAVAWSADGGDLFAAGTARDKSGKVVLRRWPGGGKGQPRDVAIARDAVMHLLASRSGVLFASADPGFGTVEGGAVTLQVGGQIADFRDVADGRFGLSADGTVVEAGLEQGGRKPVRMDLATFKLQVDPPRDSAVETPVAKDAGTVVTNWKNGAKPLVNGKPVAMNPRELARSAAVVPGIGMALIGTTERLHLVDSHGEELAAVTMPAEVWGVAPAHNGKVAVAALGDGTLRWVSLEQGNRLEELAALFLRSDGKRWMAWTREGFFAHSEGGAADMAGYLLNHGAKAEAEWVDFSRLYQLFYAPELVAKKIARTGDAEIAARLAKIGPVATVLGQHPAPAVEMVEYCPIKLADSRGFARVTAPGTAPGTANAPAANVSDGCKPIVATTTRGFARANKPGVPAAEAPIFAADLPPGMNGVRLRFRLVDRQGGIGDVDVFANDRIVANTRGFGRVKGPGAPGGAPGGADKGELVERDLALEPGQNQVWVRAYDAGNGVDARSARVAFTIPAQSQLTAAAAAAVKPAAKPRLLVLAAGIDNYPGPNALRFPVKDMTGVVNAIQKNKAYSDVLVLTLKNEEVTVANLEKKFDELARLVTPEDTVLLYFSGHGVTDDNVPSKPYYFVMVDGDLDNLEKTGFSQARFKSNLTKLSTRNILLVLDTCHSGAMSPAVVNKVHEDFGQSFYILAAAAADQTALDNYKGIDGPFAYAMIEGLDGEAAKTRDGMINQLALGTYVTQRVPELVDQQQPGHAQMASFKFAAANGEINGFNLTKAAK